MPGTSLEQSLAVKEDFNLDPLAVSQPRGLTVVPVTPVNGVGISNTATMLPVDYPLQVWQDTLLAGEYCINLTATQGALPIGLHHVKVTRAATDTLAAQNRVIQTWTFDLTKSFTSHCTAGVWSAWTQPGTVGSQGSPGPQGPQGLPGPAGTVAGPISTVAGPAGTVAGPQGGIGPQGIQGGAGPVGLTQGIQGIQGSQGIQGIQGKPEASGGALAWAVVNTDAQGNTTMTGSFNISTFTKKLVSLSQTAQINAFYPVLATQFSFVFTTPLPGSGHVMLLQARRYRDHLTGPQYGIAGVGIGLYRVDALTPTFPVEAPITAFRNQVAFDDYFDFTSTTYDVIIFGGP